MRLDGSYPRPGRNDFACNRARTWAFVILEPTSWIVTDPTSMPAYEEIFSLIGKKPEAQKNCMAISEILRNAKKS